MSDNQNEQSFNEDELKDIMDEIESLEEDYGEVEQDDAQEVAAASDDDGDTEPVEEVQEVSSDEDEIVEEDEDDVVEQHAAAEDEEEDGDEVEQILEEDDDDEDDDVDTVAQPGEEAVAVEQENNVVELNQPEAHSVVNDSPVQLSAHGQMNLAMNFEFNGAQSKIVLENGCVKINLPGVNVVFDEKTGCQISADNGMTFQLPLAVKKAS